MLAPVTDADLAVANALVLAAIDSWPLAASVRARIAPSYTYDAVDLAHMRLYLWQEQARAMAMFALEDARPRESPLTPATLLHGIYVHPARQRQGLGRRLVEQVVALGRSAGAKGILVKAQRSANDFFAASGFTLLPVADPERDYPHRWWRELPAACARRP